MRTKACFLAFLLVAAPALASLPDEDKIRAAALDYIEGYYTGDAARMEKALHPGLAKRIVVTNPETGESVLRNMTAEQLIKATAGGGGKGTPKGLVRVEVTVLDVFENAASVKIVAGEWIDYLHVARYNGEWKIVNVLWEFTPEALAKMAARH